MNKEKIFYNALNIDLQSQYKNLKKLKETYGSWEEAWLHEERKEKSGLDPKKEFEKLEKENIHLLLDDEEKYPLPLKESPLPPLGLYYKGTLPNWENALAIIGTRKATEEGKTLARTFAKELSSTCPIVSGLALGIDAMAHQGALDGEGVTVAVFANGLDQIYPSSHTHLAEKIIRQNGALISEYPLGSPPLPYRFLERNRIVSGVSRGVLIIEAPTRSGTIATARFALEGNRDVFVIPGPVHHPNFTGSHELIKKGASLVTTAEDIRFAFNLENEEKEQTPLSLSSEEATIIENLRNAISPLSIDKIAEISHLQISVVNQCLSLLIVKGLVTESEIGYSTI